LTIKRHALVFAFAALLAAPGAFAAPQGQAPPGQAPQDAVKTAPPVQAKHPRPKLDKYKGRVLAFNKAQMIVQSADNEKMVWTFQYSVDLQPKVIDWLNAGGFQYGDSVVVYTNPGTTVAVKIKGKPSKPN
jgi:hypothetical protein